MSDHQTAGRPATLDLDLGRGLIALLTRRDVKFLKWAERVNLAEILAPIKAKLIEGADRG